MGGGAGGSEDWPASYETRVRAAYLRNPVAQRAVRLVAEGLAQAVVIGSEAEAASGDSSRGLIETVADTLSLVDDGAAAEIGATERRATADRAAEEAHQRGSARIELAAALGAGASRDGRSSEWRLR